MRHRLRIRRGSCLFYTSHSCQYPWLKAKRMKHGVGMKRLDKNSHRRGFPAARLSGNRKFTKQKRALIKAGWSFQERASENGIFSRWQQCHRSGVVTCFMASYFWIQYHKAKITELRSLFGCSRKRSWEKSGERVERVVKNSQTSCNDADSLRLNKRRYPPTPRPPPHCLKVKTLTRRRHFISTQFISAVNFTLLSSQVHLTFLYFLWESFFFIIIISLILCTVNLPLVW